MSTPALQQHYLEKVVPALTKKLGYSNAHQVPRLEKIVVTSCMGKAPDRKVAVDDAVAEIQKITGQRPAITYSKKSVANFKLREGEVLGARVTLRGARMWEFLYRFINVTAPNIRDFRGISSKSFDGRGNYACGVQEQSIFPEIEIDQILFCKSRRRDLDTRQVHSFAVFQFAADQHPAMHPVVLNLFNLKLEQTVIKQDPVSGADILRKLLVAGRDQIFFTKHVSRGHHDHLPGGQGHRPSPHHAGPDFRPLQVAQDSDRTAPITGQFANRRHRFHKVCVLAVREVKTKYVRTSLHECKQHLPRGARRSDGGDYFIAPKILDRQFWLLT